MCFYKQKRYGHFFISMSFRTIVFVFFFYNVSAALYSCFPQVCPVYLGIEMIQPWLSKDILFILKIIMQFRYPMKWINDNCVCI